MLLRELPYLGEPAAPRRLRGLLAILLLRSSHALEMLAVRLDIVGAAPPAPDPLLEFYAEAGAPEGALYVDGLLLGRISGVTRL
ncbi:MAG: hypothetical protein KGN16_21815 [Burkholderiales bacterium]|nr:hypothetical protein [Burkholderiales bacterium]